MNFLLLILEIYNIQKNQIRRILKDNVNPASLKLVFIFYVLNTKICTELRKQIVIE